MARHFSIGNNKNLCKHPQETNNGWACGCKAPKKCDGVLAEREGLRQELLNETKAELLGVFDGNFEGLPE